MKGFLEMIHYYDRETMVYTACRELHNWVETTDDIEQVTCERCKATGLFQILSEQKGEAR